MHNPWFTISLNQVIIEKNASQFIGKFELLDSTDWKANSREVNAAIYENCCDARWIAELIEHGADPKEIAIGSRNVLHFLAGQINRHSGIVQSASVFIQAGVNLNQKDEWGKTPLYVAVDSAEHGYFQKPELAARFVAFITLLLESGADPNIPEKLGFTPLHMAVMNRRYELSRLLLKHGSDPTKQTTDNRSAYSRASGVLSNTTSNDQNKELQELIGEMEKSMK